MSSHPEQRQHLLDRVHELTEESYRLPRSFNSWKRREEIEWELIQLFRKIAKLSLSAEELPYWSDPDWKDPADEE